MLKHLLENNLNTPDQHGFTKGRSYLTNLLKTFKSWTEDVDQEHSVDVIFLDLKKNSIQYLCFNNMVKLNFDYHRL